MAWSPLQRTDVRPSRAAARPARPSWATLIFAAGGWVWGALLITFFVLSSLLSRYRAQFKAGLAEKFAKGSQRDLGQVLANGGMGALLALAHAWLPHPVVLFAFAGAMATVNADTWATELGVLARRSPRLITTGRPVEPGTSGGISLPGTLATLAGGLRLGFPAWVMRHWMAWQEGQVSPLLAEGMVPGCWSLPAPWAAWRAP